MKFMTTAGRKTKTQVEPENKTLAPQKKVEVVATGLEQMVEAVKAAKQSVEKLGEAMKKKAGRPKSEKSLTNAERQKRWRTKQKAEKEKLTVEVKSQKKVEKVVVGQSPQSKVQEVWVDGKLVL